MENTYETGLRLWNEWTRMWNGETHLALELAAERYTLHLGMNADTSQITSPAAMKAFVEGVRKRYDKIVAITGVGPFVDTKAGVVAGPWYAEAEKDGKRSSYRGMDTFRFEHGKIVEYWTISTEVDAVGSWSRP